MLSQHIITKPIFEALFENYSFVTNNPVSSAMQNMLNILEEHQNDADFETLQNFYSSIKKRVEGIDNAEGKQKIIVELYDKFFKTAFPKMVEQLGIVYTPVEVVDFIIYSVNDVLRKEFGRTIGDENTHILDPFTGTGTFMTRLIQSGLIDKDNLLHKYQNEIHANEIVLLAYYIATVNIENALHDQLGSENYYPFEGIVLTDTFQLSENTSGQKVFSEMFPINSERADKQKNAPIKVIIGNPPYSIGQKSANDNAQNQKYKKLDSRIESTYAKASNAGLNKSLYDAYIKAFRWSTDRLGDEGGVIAFVSNGAWLDGNSTDGFRKTIEKEFSSIYVFNLRGNQRTSGELSRKEGGKIFGGGSRTPISITLLIKNPQVTTQKATINYYDIGDYLDREEKLKIIKEFGSIESMKFTILTPNEHGDWINQRNDKFNTFISMQPEKKFDLTTQAFFNTYAVGVNTGRDAWAYNFSKVYLSNNMSNMIDFYNDQKNLFQDEKKNNSKLKVENFIDSNPIKISWTRSLRKDIERNKEHLFNKDNIKYSMYRPFTKEYLYFDRGFNEAIGLSPMFFPNENYDNIVICVSPSANDGLSLLISREIANLHFNGDTQCFPLYYYEESDKQTSNLFDHAEENGKNFIRRDGISNFILERAKKLYGKNVTKEDIFYYVYGLLHSPDYREAFANDLKKMLPRLPLVESIPNFWVFSKAGQSLADLHINYEKVEPHSDVMIAGEDSQYFRVEKFKFAKTKKEIDGKMKSVNNTSTIIYNSKITLSNIPENAYEYKINGKSAIEWVIDRYQIKTDKKSGIKNDPNDWSEEVGNPRYILDLLLSVINVSVQTVDIVNELPKLKFEE